MSKNYDISSYKNKIEWSLYLLRVGDFIVMFIWTLDKFIDPGHLIGILKSFYFIGGMSEILAYVIGAVEMIIILAFLGGVWKKYTYGFIMIAHGLTTFASWKVYLDMNLLFFTAWPMLAACIALYLLRELDVKLTIS